MERLLVYFLADVELLPTIRRLSFKIINHTLVNAALPLDDGKGYDGHSHLSHEIIAVIIMMVMMMMR